MGYALFNVTNNIHVNIFTVSKTIWKHLLNCRGKTQLKQFHSIYILIMSTGRAATYSATSSDSSQFIQAAWWSLSFLPLALQWSSCYKSFRSTAPHVIVSYLHKKPLQNKIDAETKYSYLENLSLYPIKIKACILQQTKQNPAATFTGGAFSLSIFIICLYVSLPHQGYSWYCRSVAVKKSSRTLLRYSKVGLSSGLSFQHRHMTS